MKKSTKIISVAVLALGVTSGVYAYGAHATWRMSPADRAEYVTEKITEKLELNVTQQENLGSLSANVIQLMSEVRSDRKAHIETLQQLLSEPTLDQARALQLIQQKTKMINEKAPEIIASLAGFLDSLNSEQKNQLSKHFDGHMRHHNDHN
jgi:aryl carrier-like protein